MELGETLVYVRARMMSVCGFGMSVFVGLFCRRGPRPILHNSERVESISCMHSRPTCSRPSLAASQVKHALSHMFAIRSTVLSNVVSTLISLYGRRPVGCVVPHNSPSTIHDIMTRLPRRPILPRRFFHAAVPPAPTPAVELSATTPACVDPEVYRAAFPLARSAVAEKGFFEIPGFIRPEFVERFVEEAEALREKGFRSSESHNIWLESRDDEGGGSSDSAVDEDAGVVEIASTPDAVLVPSSAPMRSSKLLINQEQVSAFNEESPLVLLFRWQGLLDLMKTAFALAELHPSVGGCWGQSGFGLYQEISGIGSSIGV